jgi:hypothetical protein
MVRVLLQIKFVEDYLNLPCIFWWPMPLHIYHCWPYKQWCLLSQYMYIHTQQHCYVFLKTLHPGGIRTRMSASRTNAMTTASRRRQGDDLKLLRMQLVLWNALFQANYIVLYKLSFKRKKYFALKYIRKYILDRKQLPKLYTQLSSKRIFVTATYLWK